MSFTIQSVYQDQFLELMNEFDPNCVYPLETVAETLRTCGIAVEIDLDRGCLTSDSTTIHVSDVQWGEKGISPLHVLCAVIDAHGFEITTRMSGTGFRYRNLLGKLADMWGIRKNFL
jgi:hypothetical protein